MKSSKWSIGSASSKKSIRLSACRGTRQSKWSVGKNPRQSTWTIGSCGARQAKWGIGS